VRSHISWREKRNTIYKDVGGLGESHIDWRRERISARTLGAEGGWIVRSHIGWGEQIILCKGVETSP